MRGCRDRAAPARRTVSPTSLLKAAMSISSSSPSSISSSLSSLSSPGTGPSTRAFVPYAHRRRHHTPQPACRPTQAGRRRRRSGRTRAQLPLPRRWRARGALAVDEMGTLLGVGIVRVAVLVILLVVIIVLLLCSSPGRVEASVAWQGAPRTHAHVGAKHAARHDGPLPAMTPSAQMQPLSEAPSSTVTLPHRYDPWIVTPAPILQPRPDDTALDVCPIADRGTGADDAVALDKTAERASVTPASL